MMALDPEDSEFKPPAPSLQLCDQAQQRLSYLRYKVREMKQT